jgi:hypothetical protein
MDEKERYERGMAKRRKVLGNAWVDRANAKKSAFNEEFQDFITRTAWGEVWTRPHYDERTRRILVPGVIGPEARKAASEARDRLFGNTTCLGLTERLTCARTALRACCPDVCCKQ